jgi:hypothetical protein
MTRKTPVKRTLLALSILALAPAAFGQARDTEILGPGPAHSTPEAMWGGAAQVLFNNGPIITGTGNGAGGANTSAIAAPGTLFGFGCQQVNGNRVADDFTIPAGQTWVINQITTFQYQTGSTTTSTFTGGSLRIWTGTPGTGSVIFGDDTTNRLTSSAFTNIYRVTSTTLTNTQRPIMANSLDVGGLTLGAGTYWIDVSYSGSLASGPWCPPVTPGTGNALQSLAGAAFAPALDGAAQQALPFLVEGTFVVPAPAPVNNPLALILLGLALFGVGAFAVSRRV